MNDSFILRDRKWREQNERVTLSSYATFSGDSKGRSKEEPEDTFRTCFERDRDRIIHSKTFRRLKHKTQVFINPDGDHFITRMTHTLNVTQIGRSIAKTLGFNTDLTEAICLGHDVGHSPFGHTGEEVLNKILDGGWTHSENSVRMLSVIEPLNLTKETINGIKIIKSFLAESFFKNKFNKTNTNFLSFSNKLINRQNIAAPLSEFLGILVIAVLLWYGGQLVLIDMELKPAAFITYMGLAYGVLTPAKSISKAFYSLKRVMQLQREYLKLLILKASFLMI